jgi:hypothetical protein
LLILSRIKSLRSVGGETPASWQTLQAVRRKVASRRRSAASTSSRGCSYALGIDPSILSESPVRHPRQQSSRCPQFTADAFAPCNLSLSSERP